MKRLFAGAAVLVAVLCTLLWRATRVPAEEPVTPGVALSSEQLAEHEVPVLLAGPEPAAGDARVAPAAPSGPDASTERTVSAGLEVRVLLGPGGAPAQGAEVFLLDEERVDPGARRTNGMFGRMDNDAELEAFALRALADAEGRAELPTPLGRTKLAARLGDGYAARELDGGEPGPIVLELAPDPPVRVRVIAEDGQPVAGVPVALCPANPDFWEDHESCPRGISGADGRAGIRPRVLRTQLRATQARVVLAIPMREPVEVAVDLEQPQGEPIELRLPPTGSVAVTLLDARGDPWTEYADVGVGLSARTRAEVGASSKIHQLHATTSDGQVLFDHVGLGIELAVWAYTLTLGDPSEIADGPLVPGERVAVVLDAGEPLRLITGRVVDEQHRPIGPAKLGIRAYSGDSHPYAVWGATTDHEGRFRSRVHVDGPIDRLELETTRKGMEFCGQPFPTYLAPGETDLGDVVLARTPLVVSGTIREASGEAVRRAKVSLHFDEEHPGVHLDIGGWGGYWASSDALGRFEARKRVTATSVGLTVRAAGFASPEKRFVPVGSSGVEIVLERAGSIAGHLAPGSPSPKLSLSIGGQPAKVGLTYGKRGEFKFVSLKPGTWTLTASFPWSEGQLDVPGLVVIAGEETRDPRLEPLDLSGIVPSVTLTAVDDRGQAVPGVRASLRQPDSEEFRDCQARREDNRVTITAGPLPLHVRLEARGFRPLELTGVDSDRTVTLARGIPVRLVFVGALPELPAGWELEGGLEPKEESTDFIFFYGADRSVASFEWAPGSALVHLSEPGSYAVFHRLVQRHAGKDLYAQTFSSEEDAALVVADGTEPQVFEIALSPETLSEMLAYIEEHE